MAQGLCAGGGGGLRGAGGLRGVKNCGILKGGRYRGGWQLRVRRGSEEVPKREPSGIPILGPPYNGNLMEVAETMVNTRNKTLSQ